MAALIVARGGRVAVLRSEEGLTEPGSLVLEGKSDWCLGRLVRVPTTFWWGSRPISAVKEKKTISLTTPERGALCRGGQGGDLATEKFVRKEGSRSTKKLSLARELTKVAAGTPVTLILGTGKRSLNGGNEAIQKASF